MADQADRHRPTGTTMNPEEGSLADTHVTITGDLSDGPDLRFTPNGNPVATFGLAVTARVKDGDT